MPDLKEAKDDAIYKVGRNVLLFQQMERLLKYLVSHGTLSGFHSELKSKFEKQKRSVSKRTLGMNVGDFLSGSKSRPPPEELNEVHFIFNFDVDVDEGMKDQIAELVAGRNYLVHHLLEDIEFASAESWLAVSARLDEQEGKLDTVTTYLKDVAQILSDSRKELADYMITEEFKQQFRGK